MRFGPRTLAMRPQQALPAAASPRAPRQAQGTRERGYFLLELTIALAITAIAGIYASAEIQQASDDSVAVGTGVYLDNLAQGAQRYIVKNFVALSAGTDVPAVANDLAPTIAELSAMGRLPTTFPTTSPNGQATTLQIVRTSCPGPSCQLTAQVCLNSGLMIRGKEREDLATTAMLAMGGRGGRSQIENPTIVRGPSMSITNPVGAVSGVVCGQSLVDAGLYDTFVRVGDTRDPTLQGGMTISGANATGEALRTNGDLAVVNPATGNVCVQILSAGTINISCNGQLNASLGTFTGPLGTVKVGTTGTNYIVDTAGRIRADAGFWSGLGSVFGDNTLGARAAGSVFTIQTNAGVDALAVHDNGRTGSRTSVATPMLGLTSTVTEGASCTSAATQVAATQVTTAANSVIGATAGGGLAICDTGSGQWVALSRTATAGAACPTNGAAAQGGSGVFLICSNGVWSSITDRMGFLVAAESWTATDGSVISKPTCGPGSTGSRLVATLGNEQQNIQYVNRYVTDNGTSWTFHMTNGNGQPIDGDVVAISYCSY